MRSPVVPLRRVGGPALLCALLFAVASSVAPGAGGEEPEVPPSGPVPKKAAPPQPVVPPAGLSQLILPAGGQPPTRLPDLPTAVPVPATPVPPALPIPAATAGALSVPLAPPALPIPAAPPPAPLPGNPLTDLGPITPGASPASPVAPALPFEQLAPAVPAAPVDPPKPGATSDAPPERRVTHPDPLTALETVRGPSADGTPLNDFWRNGVRFESADKNFSIFLAGRSHFDAVSYLAPTGVRQNIPGPLPLEDGVVFRRARFTMGGTIYKNFEFLTEIDFFNGFVTSVAENRQANVPVPTDLWVQFKELPWIGNVRIGNQKPLYSFEHLTSSRFLNFMERSLGFDAFIENFNNGFQPGVTVFDTYADKRGTWGVGVFKNTRGIFGANVGRNETEVNGRVTYLPVYDEDGRYLVHVGLGAYGRDLDQDQARYRARPDARSATSAFSPLLADTGLFFGTNQYGLFPELVMVSGPWSFQSEYYASWVGHARAVGPNNTRLADQGGVFFQSVYGEVHYFLTGEHRPYNRDSGAFTRVVPKRPVSWDRCGFTGCGAWQLTARYSYLDLNDKGIRGGEIHDMTLGLNWFLNPNMKLQWNYFLAHRNANGTAGDGFVQGFGMRTAIDY